MNLALRLYRRLARAFPHEFKLAYGPEVSQVGEDIVEEIAKRHGIGGLIRLLADIAIRVPVEYLSEMRHDMRYAARGLLRSPGFALVGIISMGLGMGLTTRIYNSKWQMLSRDLPATANARQLVSPDKLFSYYYIDQLREQKDLFRGVAAVRIAVPFNVAFQGDMGAKPERVFGQLVSPDFFSVLGVEPQRGRLLSAELDKPGDFPVVVITDRFWRNRLNSSPNAIGQTLRVNGQPATIVGITPKDFNGFLPFNPSELFVLSRPLRRWPRSWAKTCCISGPAGSSWPSFAWLLALPRKPQATLWMPQSAISTNKIRRCRRASTKADG